MFGCLLIPISNCYDLPNRPWHKGMPPSPHHHHSTNTPMIIIIFIIIIMDIPKARYGKSSLPLPSPEPWVNRIFLVLALLVCKRTPLNRCTGKDALYKSRQNEATNMSWPIKTTSHHGWHLLVNSHQHLAVAIHLWGWLTVDQPATNSWLVTKTGSTQWSEIGGNSGTPLRLELLPIQNSNYPVESGILNSGVLLDFSMKQTKNVSRIP